jgi:biofilm PGA synthesis N-glycosyltransferase PgaC
VTRIALHLNRPLTPAGEAGHSRAQRVPSQTGKVIVLIPAHNETTTIGATITAVLGQSRPPDELYVLTDNAAAGLAEAAAVAAMEFARDREHQQFPFGPLDVSRIGDGFLTGCRVTITCTVRNAHKKAGNLNAALSMLLPRCDGDAIIMGFDADSTPDRRFIENALSWQRLGYGAVGATFHGRSGGGLLGLLQRCEFARFARHQHRKASADVLSGTGWAIAAGVMRQVAASRPDGMVYDVTSIVEDFALTLLLKTMGVAMVAPADCRVTTDVMVKVRDWVSQRLRWQHGTLDELRHYGWTRHTREMWVRQFLIYVVMAATPLTVVYLAWSFELFGWQGINPMHAPLYLAGIVIVLCEQAWQARKAGWRAIASTLAVVPDLVYSAARQVVYIRAAYRLLRKRGTGWGAGTDL